MFTEYKYKRSYSKYIIISLFLFLHACSVKPLKVVHSLEEDFEVKNYPTVQVSRALQNESDLSKSIHNQILHTLAKKGYVVKQEDASLVFVYDLYLQEGTANKKESEMSPKVIEASEADGFDSVSIRIYAFDPVKNKHVWMAGSFREMKNVDLSTLGDGRLEDRIDELFKTLPDFGK